MKGVREMYTKTELKIKIKTTSLSDLRYVIKEIKEMEKEYSCHCTLLEIEAN